MIARIKTFFFDYQSRMSRRQFWPGFISGNIILFLLTVGIFFTLFSFIATRDFGPMDYTQNRIIDGDNVKLNAFLHPQYQVGAGEKLDIAQECKVVDGQAQYTTRTKLTRAGQEPIVTVSHEPFDNLFFRFFAKIPVLNQMNLVSLIIIFALTTLINVIISLRLLRNSVCRLRDGGFTPWLVLLYIANGLGQLVLLILFCYPSKKQELS